MTVPVLLGASFVSFSLLRLTPIDPAKAYLTVSNVRPTDEAVSAIRSQLGLDRPFFSQFATWLGDLLHFNFGTSFYSKLPVTEELYNRLPITAALAISSLILAVAVSIPLGLASALQKDRFIDHVCRVLAFLGSSAPQFGVAYLLIYFLSVKWDMFPLQGADSWRNYVLPAITLSFSLIATYSRLLRAGLLKGLNEPFVLYAKARGMRTFAILTRHVLRHAIRPVITAAGMNLGKLFAGSVIVEQIFGMQGMGGFFLESVFRRDYPVIQGYILIMAFIFVFGNFIADVIQTMLDPRSALEQGKVRGR
ncbi:nickel ABC transporter permease subunit NikB [Paenibacillus glycanilyticus]|uniref:Nickel import system permease protein NikB n=2 Tax=Paenibacillus glycanilyticus TaxID=126569 RepID=A0ABQ6G7G2_9BACL|nr:nickel ABC transporter permease subunit NikB [Paenibacillus glycanilyticus]